MQDENFNLAILYKVGLILLSLVFLIVSVVLTSNIINALDFLNAEQQGVTDVSKLNYFSVSTILAIIVTALGWLFSILFLSFSIASLFKKFKTEKTFYLGFIIVAVIFGIFFAVMYGTSTNLLDFQMAVNPDQYAVDRSTMAYFAEAMSYQLLSFIMLIFLIPLSNAKQPIKDKEINKNEENIESEEENIYSAQYKELENQIKEQKQKQKLFQLQQELEELKQNTEAMKGNIHQNNENE